MAKIELKHIYKKYENGYEAIHDFNLEIEDKEFIIFVGPSGCGKSTILRMIAGLEEISEGELYINGTKMNHVSSANRDIAMVFQNYALYPHMSVRKNIAYSLRIHHEKEDIIEQKVQKAAEILGLTEVMERKPGQLSGGQKQRVAMGRAIVRNPKVFLMDEPLSNLDAKLRGQMRVEIAHLYHKLNSTFVYVTHDQTEAMTLGTRIVVMKDGIIQQVDTPQNLFHYPTNQFVAGFIGTPPMNFMHGEVCVDNNMLYITELGKKIDLTKEKLKKIIKKNFIGKNVVVGIRPDHISVDKVTEGGEGVVDVYEMLGSEAIVHINTDNDTESKLVVNINASQKISIGDRVKITCDIGKIHIFESGNGTTITN